MKTILIFLVLYSSVSIYAQERINPLVKSQGGIYPVPEATVKPKADMEYKIVIDVMNSSGYESVNDGLNNVARLLNLHALGGVPIDNIHVVLAIHANSTYSVMKNQAYRKKFGVDNPNILLIRELKKEGVKLTVCGQSLIARGVSRESVLEEVEVATSMLTTVTTYQLMGYAMLKF